LNTRIASNSISFDSFQTPFRRDRLDKQCGGDAVHVNKHIHAERIHDLEVRGLESV